MASTPDLSRIIEVIMQNPELISQISSLMGNTDEDNRKSDSPANSPAEYVEHSISTANTSSENVEMNTPKSNAHSHRKELLGALKPYLSESRRTAIDSMISISDILSMMRK